MAVRLWPTLPKDTAANGLAALERPLLDDPSGPFYFIAEVNRRRATIDDDEDATTPTIRVLHGEALLGEFSTVARELLLRAQLARCGPPPKPAPKPAPMFEGNGDDLPDNDGTVADIVNSGTGVLSGTADDADGGSPVNLDRHFDRVNDETTGLGEDDETPSEPGETEQGAGRVPFLSAVADE